MNSDKIRVFVVGLGNMGLSHAQAYHANPGFEIVGLANRSEVKLPSALQSYARFAGFEDGLAKTRPDLVSINTLTDSHAEYAIRAMEAGAHVFIEKPLAATVEEAEREVATAMRLKRKLVIGYILRHHPSWMEFIRIAREMGGPYVMRMNLNQQSHAEQWATHKRLMQSTSPIVDCGVHYVDVMCQICDARPRQVRGMGVRLTGEIAPDMYNYGHLQVTFDDGSVGWYEAAWGPMISETAFFVKDVMTPKGCVSIVMKEGAKSSDMETHTKTSTIRTHWAQLDQNGQYVRPDRDTSMADEPGHQALCDREQAYVLKAIREDLDLSQHMADGVNSLKIVLAADRSMREGRAIDL
jgi:predicted dehydrogenase